MKHIRAIPPLAARLAEGRPVLTQAQVTDLAKRVMTMTSATTVQVQVRHTARVITRMANGQVMTSDDGDDLEITLGSRYGQRESVNVSTNQLDDSVLRAMVQQCEAIARAQIGSDEDFMASQPQVQDQLVPIKLWHDETIRAMTTTRRTVIPDILGAVVREQLNAAGFVGIMARAEALITNGGISVYNEETDSEVTVTARTPDFKSSGWGGQAERNWSKIKYMDVAARAVKFAKLGANPMALEPGRRTAILSPNAVVQILRFLAGQFDGAPTNLGYTGFSKNPSGNRVGERFFDPRINMSSDPADPEGGYRPYYHSGYRTPPMKWVEKGVLKALAYQEPAFALAKGLPYSSVPYSIRLSGGTTSIDQMISQCKEGVYVNRVTGVNMIDDHTGLTTGVTCDGCLLVKDGKIDRGVKNFRFLDSPFFFLNNIEALGVPERAAFGHTPPSEHFYELDMQEWPRPPIIVPPVMVRDFNFSSLADAV